MLSEKMKKLLADNGVEIVDGVLVWDDKDGKIAISGHIEEMTDKAVYKAVKKENTLIYMGINLKMSIEAEELDFLARKYRFTERLYENAGNIVMGIERLLYQSLDAETDAGTYRFEIGYTSAEYAEKAAKVKRLHPERLCFPCAV